MIWLLIFALLLSLVGAVVLHRTRPWLFYEITLVEDIGYNADMLSMWGQIKGNRHLRVLHVKGVFGEYNLLDPGHGAGFALNLDTGKFMGGWVDQLIWHWFENEAAIERVNTYNKLHADL